MQPNDNFAPLKYEADPRPVEQKPAMPLPVFSVPPDMKYENLPPVRPSVPPPSSSRKRFVIAAVIFFVFALACLGLAAVWPPSGFPSGKVFSVPDDASLGQVADDLYAGHLIKSVSLFKAAVIVISGERGVKAGDYLFQGRESAPEIAWRLVRGEEGLVPIKTTIPEGWDVRQISAILGKSIPDFATSTFIALALPDEGYLFPDTYFFTEKSTPDDVVQSMRGLFDQKISSVASRIAASGRATSSVVIMASLLEREATSSSDRRIIAGILWKRLDADMPLDVDAALAYVLGVNGTKLTSADLATASPYNTYLNIGLPPTPIGNPGLETIQDALDPTTTDYWYYLSDSNGNIHYAKTYDEQLANEAKYIAN